MGMILSRRQALGAMGSAGIGGLAALTGCRSVRSERDAACGGPRWWRGNLHMHTYWSDGRVFPEQAVDLYKNKLGYDFLALSEHNTFADRTDQWKPVLEKEGKWPPDVTKPYFDVYERSAFGKDAQTPHGGPAAGVRVRTPAVRRRLKRMFEEPGRFFC
jgi:hypothetical protein